MHTRSVLVAALVAAASLIAATPLVAQQVPDRALTLSAGPMAFDASNIGSASVIALSAAQTLPSRWFAVEGSLGYAGMPKKIAIAEVQAQLQWPGRLIRPYVGVGGGMVHYLEYARSGAATKPSLSYGGGLRAALTNAWGLRLDLRGRGWDGYQSTELTLGITRRF